MIFIKDYKEMFIEQADQIKDWKKMSVDDLMNEYIKKENEFGADSYLSAIICKLWNRMTNYYYKNIKSVTYEDCIDWMMNAILSALRYRRWLDPTNDMYKDPKGPSKSINVSMKSQEQGFYQYSNKPKRKINYGIYSIEQLQQVFDSNNFLYNQLIEKSEDEQYELQSLLIQKYYDTKKIFNIFVLSTILFSATIPKTEDLNKFILNNLKNMNEKIITIISAKYFLDETILYEEFKNIKNYSRYLLSKKIDKSIEQIRKDIHILQEG